MAKENKLWEHTYMLVNKKNEKALNKQTSHGNVSLSTLINIVASNPRSWWWLILVFNVTSDSYFFTYRLLFPGTSFLSKMTVSPGRGGNEDADSFEKAEWSLLVR